MVTLALQVRQGAENMLSQYSGNKDKRLLVEAEELLQDSKAKMEYLRYTLLELEGLVFTSDGAHWPLGLAICTNVSN